MRLEELYEIYSRWLHIKDTRRIDIVLAAALTRKMTGTPIWLILVGASGDGKTEQINALEDDIIVDEMERNTKIIRNFTARTLVSADKNVRPLAPQLKDKLLMIPDMSQLLKLHPNEKAQVWAQLRDLYDGNAGKQAGTGVDYDFTGIRVTLIAGATPSIDSQILIHQDLGTRELLYRTEDGEDNKKELMEKVWMNEEYEEKMRRELKEVTNMFLMVRDISRINISTEVQRKLEFFTEYLRLMRATAEVDSYTGEVRNTVTPEQPTRVLKQLKRLFIALKSLDDEYSDHSALSVIEKIVHSSASQLRQRIFTLSMREDRMSTNQVAQEMKVGHKSAYTELNILWNLNLLTMDEENESGTSYPRLVRYWQVNTKHGLFNKLQGGVQQQVPTKKQEAALPTK